MEVPDYLLRQWFSRYQRMALNATADVSDTRTLNAIRLAKKDIKLFSKYVKQ